METFFDRNGNPIIEGSELNIPLDVFSTGIVVKKNNTLSLELRYDGGYIPLNGLSEKLLKNIEIVNILTTDNQSVI